MQQSHNLIRISAKAADLGHDGSLRIVSRSSCRTGCRRETLLNQSLGVEEGRGLLFLLICSEIDSRHVPKMISEFGPADKFQSCTEKPEESRKNTEDLSPS